MTATLTHEPPDRVARRVLRELDAQCAGLLDGLYGDDGPAGEFTSDYADGYYRALQDVAAILRDRVAALPPDVTEDDCDIPY